MTLVPRVRSSFLLVSINVFLHFVIFWQIIWNSATRSELLKFVDQQRVSQLPDGSYDMDLAQHFKYKTLSDELHIGEVYLRVYNEQPDFEISQPEMFCDSLLDFINELVEERKQQLSLEGSSTDTEQGGGTHEVHEVPVLPETLAGDSSVKSGESIQQNPEDSVPSAPNEVVRDLGLEGETLVKHLVMALTALLVRPLYIHPFCKL